MYKQEETTAELIESFQPFMDTFGNLIQGGIGIFEVQGDLRSGLFILTKVLMH